MRSVWTSKCGLISDYKRISNRVFSFFSNSVGVGSPVKSRSVEMQTLTASEDKSTHFELLCFEAGVQTADVARRESIVSLAVKSFIKPGRLQKGNNPNQPHHKRDKKGSKNSVICSPELSNKEAGGSFEDSGDNQGGGFIGESSCGSLYDGRLIQESDGSDGAVSSEEERPRRTHVSRTQPIKRRKILSQITPELMCRYEMTNKKAGKIASFFFEGFLTEKSRPSTLSVVKLAFQKVLFLQKFEHSQVLEELSNFMLEKHQNIDPKTMIFKMMLPLKRVDLSYHFSTFVKQCFECLSEEFD